MSPKEMLAKLIAFDTVSANSNRAMIDFIADYLGDLGIEARIAPNDDNTKADLIATIGPSVEGGIILSGHSDVVPVEGQAWDTDPFEMIEADGKLYGRGTCDMKGFIATTLALVPEFLAADIKRPFHLVFSYDEEVGCLGAPATIARYCKDFPKPLCAIIGEPTEMRIANANKGVSIYKTTLTGRPGHSSDPGAGANAIGMAADCIRFLGRAAEELKISGVRDERFKPPHTTISVGTITGGNALNIIAETCTFAWDCRSISGGDGDATMDAMHAYCEAEILPAMREIASEAGIVTEKHCDVPPLIQEDDNPAEALVRQLSGQNQVEVISFAAEAGLFQDAGIPSVIFGPGSIAQAHKPNEFLKISELDAVTHFLRRLAEWSADQVAPG